VTIRRLGRVLLASGARAERISTPGKLAALNRYYDAVRRLEERRQTHGATA